MIECPECGGDLHPVSLGDAGGMVGGFCPDCKIIVPGDGIGARTHNGAVTDYE